MSGDVGHRPKSVELPPGTKVRGAGGGVCTLDRRKKPGDVSPYDVYHPGWWLTDGSGLADFVLDEGRSGWEVVQ